MTHRNANSKHEHEQQTANSKQQATMNNVAHKKGTLFLLLLL